MRKNIAATAVGAAILAVTATACGDMAIGQGGQQEAAMTDADFFAGEDTNSEPQADDGTNERGNTPTKLGEPQSVGDVYGDSTDLTFSIVKTTVDPGCTEEYSESPERGHFLVLDVAVATDPSADQFDLSGYLDAMDFSVLTKEGTTVGGLDTVATYGCIADTERLPYELTPGSKYQGQVLLDVPEKSGTLVYRPAFMEDGGWELKY